LLEQENKDHNSQMARNLHAQHNGGINHMFQSLFIIRITVNDYLVMPKQQNTVPILPDL
jgi:hypothetical protein